MDYQVPVHTCVYCEVRLHWVIMIKPGIHELTALPVQTQYLQSTSMASRGRTRINPQQLKVLQGAYNREKRPSKAVKEQLVAETGLLMKIIQVWFQN